MAGNDNPEPRQYPKPIAFDVLPVAGSFSGDQGYMDEEFKLVHESRKILDLPDLRVSIMCTRVPVINGHSEAVWIETREPLSAHGFQCIRNPKSAQGQASSLQLALAVMPADVDAVLVLLGDAPAVPSAIVIATEHSDQTRSYYMKIRTYELIIIYGLEYEPW